MQKYKVPIILIISGLLIWILSFKLITTGCASYDYVCGFFTAFIWMFIVVPISIILISIALVKLYKNRTRTAKDTYIFSFLGTICGLLLLYPFWAPILLSPKKETPAYIQEQQQKLDLEEKQAIISRSDFDKAMQELYNKLKADMEGEHTIKKGNYDNITLDNGKTYILDNTPLIKRTADPEIIQTYKEITSGNYRNKKYLFKVLDYSFFKNYYGERYRTTSDIQQVISNFNTTNFLIPIPKKN